MAKVWNGKVRLKRGGGGEDEVVVSGKGRGEMKFWVEREVEYLRRLKAWTGEEGVSEEWIELRKREKEIRKEFFGI